MISPGGVDPWGAARAGQVSAHVLVSVVIRDQARDPRLPQGRRLLHPAAVYVVENLFPLDRKSVV